MNNKDNNDSVDINDILNLPDEEGNIFLPDDSTCPYCGEEEVDDLEFVSEMMLEALEESGVPDVPSAVCGECYDSLNSKITLVGKAKIEQKKRLENINLKYQEKAKFFKAGQALTKQKIYKDARSSYMEYLDSLCFIFELEDINNLQPGMFNEKIRLKESTIICFVMADLIRIYDQLSLSLGNMSLWFEIFKRFLPHAKKRKKLIQKITNYSKKSKNKETITPLVEKHFNKKGGCFIATAVFTPSEVAPLSILRDFRDHTLRNTPIGRNFIYFYYQYSPTIAKKLHKQPLIARFIRASLRLFCWLLCCLER